MKSKTKLLVSIAFSTVLFVAVINYLQQHEAPHGNLQSDIDSRVSAVKKTDTQSFDSKVVINPEVQVQSHISEPNLDSSPYPLSPTGLRVLTKIRDTFDKNFMKAQDGDARSMFLISQVIENCKYAYPHKSLDDFNDSEFAQSGQSLEIWIEAIRTLFPDCGYVNTHLPEGVLPGDWEEHWLELAAENGYPIAVLDLAAPRGYQDRKAAQDLVNISIQDEEQRHMALQHAANLVTSTTLKRDSELTRILWEYLSCKYNTICDDALFLGIFRELYPHEVKAISDASIRFHTWIESDNEIDVSQSTIMEEMFQPTTK